VRFGLVPLDSLVAEFRGLGELAGDVVPDLETTLLDMWSYRGNGVERPARKLA